MSTCVLVVYYSAYGHTFKLAQAVREGAESIKNTEVRIRRVPELKESEKELNGQEAYKKAKKAQSEIKEVEGSDLYWADGICWGSPTRFGNMASQMKQFIDTLGKAWIEGALENKPAGIFTSTASIHGGQETTLISMMIPLFHLGMIVMGTPYGKNPQLNTTEGIGGTPYGPSTLAGADGSRQPVEKELATARSLGSRIARATFYLKDMRES